MPAITTFKASIADVLKIVNTTHQSILSDDVLKALGEERNPEGHYAKRVKFSLSQQTDEEYNLAVRSGDMEKAQEMVEAAAKKQGIPSMPTTEPPEPTAWERSSERTEQRAARWRVLTGIAIGESP